MYFSKIALVAIAFTTLFTSSLFSMDACITTTTGSKPVLQNLTHLQGKQQAHYGVGKIFQLTPDKAALTCGLKAYGPGSEVIDLTGGTDLFIVNNINSIDPNAAIQLSRNIMSRDEKSNKIVQLVISPLSIGFVPAGAYLDASFKIPHPYAGTGFGFAVCLGYPTDGSNPFNGQQLYMRMLVQQYRYDDSNGFQIISSELADPNSLLETRTVTNNTLSYPVPDGEDFLVPIVTKAKGSSEQVGVGVSRCKFINGKWKLVDFVPVTGQDGSFEPSMVRMPDSSLVLCARHAEEIIVWASNDNGKHWTRKIYLQKAHSSTPITVNRTTDGSAFLAGNPYMEPYTDRTGKTVHSARRRTITAIWPLNLNHPNFIMDTENSSKNGKIEFTGTWSQGSIVSGFEGKDYNYSTGGSSAKVRFYPAFESSGAYSIYLKWTAHPERAKKVQISIRNSDGSASAYVDQTKNGGIWNSLGTYTFDANAGNYIEISNQSADGVVVADAIQIYSNPDNSPHPFIAKPVLEINWDQKFRSKKDQAMIWADHYNSNIIRFKDGIRAIACICIWARDEFSGQVPLFGQSGCWIEEILPRTQVSNPIWYLK